jgi:hypothetical protein
VIACTLWLADRARTWDEPRWDRAGFVALRHSEDAGRSPESWIIPVNPDCPHCSDHLARAVALRGSRVPVHALVVDQSVRPPEDVFAAANVDAAWWDSAGTWRRRWGHRRYGEIMVFDGRGRLLRTEPPGARVGPEPGFGVPPDDH